MVNFRNDYWTVTSGIGYIIDDKTDFYADYYFYCANDYLEKRSGRCAIRIGRNRTCRLSDCDAQIKQEHAPDAEVRLFQLQGRHFWRS